MKYDIIHKSKIICLHKKVFCFMSELGKSMICATCRKTVFRDMSTYPERNYNLLKNRDYEIIKPNGADYEWLFKEKR